MTIVHTYK